MGPVTTQTDRAVDTTLQVIGDIFGEENCWPVRVRLWNGDEYGPLVGAPATVVLNHPWSLRSILWPPSTRVAGEAYVYGDFDVEGDLEGGLMAIEAVDPSRILSSPSRLAGIASRLRQLPSPPKRAGQRGARPSGELHSVERDREAVCFHYDVSNEFYSLWLDRNMQYSCGYFAEDRCTLDEAQIAKLDLICKKLGLRPGETLLDIGCGWGGLARYAAEKYGVRVLGVTLSEPQAALANDRLKASGLADQARVEVRDYREVRGSFDKIVSVGMVEHVGDSRLGEYFDAAFRALEPGGIFLNHAIATAWSDAPVELDSFVSRYVFPDGELVPISRMLSVAESSGFEVRDVESLREHYARTLRHWVANLESKRDEALRHVDEVTYRIWKLYMTGSALSFQRGDISVFQTLLHKPSGGPSSLPATRLPWYQDA